VDAVVHPGAHPGVDPDRASDTDQQRAILGDLINLGAGFARILHDQAAAQPEAAADLATAFDRVTRAVRRTILLCRHLDTEPRQAAINRTIARKKIIRRVEDDIAGMADSPEQAESLRESLRERLDAPDLDDDIANRPIPEVVEEICRDLGIADDCGMNLFQPRGPAELAALRALAARPTPPEGPVPPGPTVRPKIRWPQPDDAQCAASWARFEALSLKKTQKKALLF
jgi:hypothetical protein